MATIQTRVFESRVTDVVLFLVHSNLFISMAATSVALSTMLLVNLHIEVLPLFIVFAVTLFVYSFNRLTDTAEDRKNIPQRVAFIRQYGPLLLIVGTILYTVATTIAIASAIPGAPAMVVPLVVALLYSVFGFKRVLLVKNLLVGLSWGLIPLGVGVYYDVLFSPDILFLFGFITVSITVAAVVFDIKDIEGDQIEGIRTIPILVGPRRTRQLAIGLSFLLGAVVVVLLLAGILGVRYVSLFVFLGYMIGYSTVATTDRTPLFYGFIIDGEHLVLTITLVLFELVPST